MLICSLEFYLLLFLYLVFVKCQLGCDERYGVREEQESMVAGRLKNNFNFWKHTLEASPFVLNIIKNGYALPFVTKPPSGFHKNNASSLKNRSFVEECISELLHSNCIEVIDPPFCVNPLSVVESKKKRLVLDLRHVNKHLKINKFRYKISKQYQTFSRKISILERLISNPDTTTSR